MQLSGALEGAEVLEVRDLDEDAAPDIAARQEEEKVQRLLAEISEVTSDVQEVEDEMRRQRFSDELCGWAEAYEARRAEFQSRSGDPRAAAALVDELSRRIGLLRDASYHVLQETARGQELQELIAHHRRELDPQGPRTVAVFRTLEEALNASAVGDKANGYASSSLPTSSALDLKDALRCLKRQLGEALDSEGDAGSAETLLDLLGEMDRLKLNWDAVRETAIGKEVGRCAKHSDPAVADRAKALVGQFHKLAKTGAKWTR